MNQIKYLVSAFLLLFLLVLLAFFASKILSTEFVAKRPVAIDDVEPAITPVSYNSKGKTLFSANCATCHALDKTLTGPALRGVENRGPWTNRKNLIKWVHNPAVMIPRFAYTRSLAQAFGGQVMPAFPQLTDAQIEAIFDYIKQSPAYFPGTPVAMQ